MATSSPRTKRAAESKSSVSPRDPHPATDNSTDVIKSEHLRIQAPEESSVPTSQSSGPSSTSPQSGISVPTSPADGLITPDGSDASAKRRRLADDDSAGSPATSTSPPLFLEKTCEMLEKCSPDIASWSPNGDSFIVKNPVAFAEHVIPIYFKHKNFSSFVRQLNFYGFRKVRVVDPEITGNVDPKDWWEFRHDKFQRDRKDLLKEIKRRSLPAGSHGDHTGRSSIDRAEIEELRSEVSGLREQIQSLNKHMFSVMQIMMARNLPPPQVATTAPLPSLPSVSFPSAPPPYPILHGLPPPHPQASSGASKATGKRPSTSNPSSVAVAAATALASGFQLRSLPSIVGPNGAPPTGFLHPPPPSGPATTGPASGDHPAVDWEIYARHAFQAAQFAHAHAQKLAQQAAQQQASAPSESSVPAITGLKRPRSQQRPTSPSPSTPANSSSTGVSIVVPSTTSNLRDNPDAAVRHMSMLVTQIRDDLLQCIIGRTLTFIRVQLPGRKALSSPDVDAVADQVVGDIQQKLVAINQADQAIHGGKLTAPSETSHMYRVEILKFVSKELPRAMAEAVEKRLPAPTKKTLNRSLLALMVQKAQAALETQMRVETAGSPVGGSSVSSASSSAKQAA